MATEVQPGSEPKVGTLVTGIIDDAQELLKQQLALFKHEVREDIEGSRDAAIAFSASMVLVLNGLVLLSTMLALGFHEWYGWSYWASFGLVGAVLTLIGVAIATVVVVRLRQSRVLSRQASKALTENIEWKTKPH